MTTEDQRNQIRPCRDVMCVNTRNVPKATRDAFKAYCARRGYTMEKATIALMKKAAKEDLVLPDARKEVAVPSL